MTRIVLEIQDDKDLRILLPLLERLGINITKQSGFPDEDNLEYHYRIIDEGVQMEDQEKFLKDFDERREDRPLPGRN
jgi:hypothetical protein